MTEYRVPIGCTGLDVEGHGRFGATRDGRITVDSPAAQRHIEKVGRSNGWMIHKVLHGSPSGTASRVCGTCGFVGYGWQKNCPRGHGEMPFGDPRQIRAGAAPRAAEEHT